MGGRAVKLGAAGAAGAAAGRAVARRRTPNCGAARPPDTLDLRPRPHLLRLAPDEFDSVLAFLALNASAQLERVSHAAQAAFRGAARRATHAHVDWRTWTARWPAHMPLCAPSCAGPAG
jgi:hypothetical protein